ncbi:adenylyltransferase/sulfurtransferase MoeZ [Sanguibacter hominis ATCC BAA-789]|uniref:Adenylyltransferase/sulfurtransferase MoeZ n=1 Tax=Sanguibacter hominis ATCC BAA-789 TaxID=1312740 RepID=A0A9X5IRD1_9MICO|nr:ThiF family adenylyltransferase [Sanguibacter hominis]NKX92643.1 adenylyltransferase/sulfurtransferase MoeZ [Sanguibacter hominis ATCC BAA-789]
MLAPLVAVGPPLTPDDVERFSRHLLLAGFGEEAQRRVRNARVCVLGAGGLGSPAISYLVAAGVGTLGVVDDDVVALSNLQRQVLHRTEDVGTLKTRSAARAARALDPGVDVVLHDVRLTEANADEILRGYDLVLDGTDNFDTRYLVSDACARLGLPVVWASVLQMDAQVSVFWADAPDGRGVTLRDLFPEPPAPGSVPSCSQAGVLGAMCGQVGSLMATEAIKLVAGVGDVLLGRVLVIDALRSRWTEVPLVAAHGPRTDSHGSHGAVTSGATSGAGSGNPGSGQSVTSATDLPAAATVLPDEITARELRRRLDAREAGEDDVVVVDVRTTQERDIRTIPGSVHVPLDVLLTADGRALVPRDRDVVLFCAVGGRSAQALTLLRAAGWTRVAHLPGGMTVWPEA